MSTATERVARRRVAGRGGRSTTAALATAALATALAVLLGASAAGAAWVRPLLAQGDFQATVDAVNIWRSDGGLDVALLMAVPNQELAFAERRGLGEARLKATARLEGPGGQASEREREYTFVLRDLDDAAAGGLQQVFALILQDVPVRWGVVHVRLEDLQRKRPSLVAMLGGENAASEAVGDWEAPERARLEEGLLLGDPLFMGQAPLDLWRERDPAGEDLAQSELFGHLAPDRRYGLGRDHLQLYFQIDPPRRGRGAESVFLQILARDLDFALRDTIRLDERRRASLAAGQPVGLFYEMDVNLLPPGTYQLSAAPGDGQGRGWLTEFDVSWQIGNIARAAEDVQIEGLMVLDSARRARFEAANPVERNVILEEFWGERDPVPETPQNEARLEFQRRMAYVRQHLGGFSRTGTKDPRGEIYLLLGPPEEIQAEAMPLNRRDLEDATVRVYDKFAAERIGQTAKGDQATGKFYSPSGPIPLPDSYRSRRELAAHRHEAGRNQAFELWIYEQSGRQLFPNQYSGQNLGLRFLFVDRTGSGKNWELQSTNANDLGDGISNPVR